MGTCFVVMGFGQKTDFATGRTLDLDKSYRLLIKPAVESCGLTCVRADEIRHSGVIDAPMYEQLLDADLVIADLSTANANAMYELGVRHALRPLTTIVIAEDQLKYPFDVNHTVILKYEHMGKGIEYEEVVNFRQSLVATIQAVQAARRPDSPVYTFLPQLDPPRKGKAAGGPAPAAPSSVAAAAGAEPVVGVLLEQANKAMDRGDFLTAKALFGEIRGMKPADQPWTINDDYLVQRLALATYKSKLPTPLAALEEAQGLLAFLGPETSNDTETLGQWGSVQKRLWELKASSDPSAARAHLDAAVQAYERGFYLRNDHYNGINFAYLLNLRASLSPPADAIADFVQARRVRQQVIRFCEQRANAALERATDQTRLGSIAEEDYWIVASLAEAWAGLGDDQSAELWLQRAFDLPVTKSWMRDTTNEQLGKLRALLADSPLVHLAGRLAAPGGAGGKG